MTQSPPEDVAAALGQIPAMHQTGLQKLRQLILEVADELDAAPVNEVLRWGQPSFLPARQRDGTAIRLGISADGRHLAMFFHCQSTVLADFQDQFPDDFRYEGRRAIWFAPGEDLQPDKLRLCIGHALTYHARKRRSR